MSDTLYKLVLVCPDDLADAVASALLDMEPALPAFTTFRSDGHGLSFETASMTERVRGHVGRRIFWLVLKQGEAPDVLAHLAKSIRNPHVTYWTEPVLEFGRLS